MDEEIQVDAGVESGAPEQEAKVEPSWYLDEGVPGIGDRPEWLPQKYKTMRDAMKARDDLEKKLGTAPVDNYDFGDFKEVFDSDNPAFTELAAFAKEKRVPQEVFSKVLESIDKYGKSFLPDAAAEKAALGENADQRIEVLGNWADANLTEGTAGMLKSMIGDFVTANSVKALEEIRSKLMDNGTTVPNGSAQGAGEVESISSLQDELSLPANYEKYQNDLTYRRDWENRIAKASQHSGLVDKHGS